MVHHAGGAPGTSPGRAGGQAPLALTTPGVDVQAVLQVQRRATMAALQELTRLKTQDTGPRDLAWQLVLDSMLFQAETEVRRLDHCAATLVRHSPAPLPTPLPAQDPAEEASAR
ncbi:hypothetical protein [Amycolatopsis sp. NPDC051716]|uniref:hypothetical protein n=1 Tax=Amycolatopsis sp. NPDC051716 TaxID=3155804 RepID=UPI003448CF2A